MDTERRGQAIVELALGLVAFMLVLSTILSFSRLFLASVENAQTVRRNAGIAAQGAHGLDEAYSSSSKTATETITVPALRKATGRDRIAAKDEAHIPAMGL